MRSLKVGFIGNFMPGSQTCHSTECDRKWSFEKLGHIVITFQENKTSADQLMNAMPHLDMLIYSHTHDPSYVIKDLKRVFRAYKANGKPTVSVHLDRWLWLKRVEDVGNEATWFTEYIFMADASPEAEELYDGLGLNWYFLKPGVIERDCYMAIPNKSLYPHEIIFVGSKGYHPEYPYRKELIDWLYNTYGAKFAHYGGDGICPVRGNELNVLYASAKVVVGDSCFGGRPRYVSDRYYETRGRGGFLIHPHVEGIDTLGVENYEHGNFGSLKKVIDYYLENDSDRETMRRMGFNWVRQYGTYTNRSQEMIDIIFGDKK